MAPNEEQEKADLKIPGDHHSPPPPPLPPKKNKKTKNKKKQTKTKQNSCNVQVETNIK